MEEVTVKITRGIYKKGRSDEAFEDGEVNSCSNNIKAYSKKIKKGFTCSWSDIVRVLFIRVPLINTLYNYNLRKQLLGDIIGGLSIGLIHIPQGMGFSIIIGLPAVYGLYSAFWPALIYMFFGTGHHISAGPMALIMLMIRSVVDREVALLNLPPVFLDQNETVIQMTINIAQGLSSESPNLNSYSYESVHQVGTNDVNEMINTTAPFDIDAYKVSIAMSLTLLVGIMQFIMGILHLGIITTIMPDPFVSGLTVGAAFHIVTSQVKFMLGITLPNHNGMFSLPLTWAAIAMRIPHTHIADLIIGVLGMTALLLINIQINNRFKDKLIAPIPSDLVIVAIVCLISYFGDLEGNFGVKIIKTIPSSMIPPVIPDIHFWGDFIVDAFMIALMSFSILYSMSTIFGIKHNYTVDSNQELLAIGLCHMIGSLFGSFAGSAAPPRCQVLDRSQATSQVSGIVATIFLLFAILLMGPLFEPLPNSLIGAVITVAVLPLFLQATRLKTLWRINKYDFCICLVACLSVTFLSIRWGLIIGIGFSIATVIVQVHLSKGIMLTSPNDDDVYVSNEVYKKPANKQSNIYVYQFQGNLNFLSKDRFKSQLLHLLPSSTVLDRTNKDKSTHIQKVAEFNDLHAMNEDTSSNSSDSETKLLNRFVIFDLSQMSYIDFIGVSTVKKMQAHLAKDGVEVVLACGNDKVTKTIYRHGPMWANGKEISSYVTVIDAVTMCKHLTEEGMTTTENDNNTFHVNLP